MAFMAQIRLSDVPGLESNTDSLLSFHYCQQCAFDGQMSWGTGGSNESGFNVSVITGISTRRPDGIGLVAQPVMEPHSVRFRDVMEIPGYADITAIFPEPPDDYPMGEDDDDENIYPGLVHVSRSKLGGWPSWAHWPATPATGPRERIDFVAQLDAELSDPAPWCGGGYAYLFLITQDDGASRGALVLQTT